MRGWPTAVVCVAVVIAAAYGAQRMATTAWDSVVHYHTPYRLAEHRAGEPRLARRVVLVTVDGLRLDTSRRLPFLNALRARGADGTLIAARPTLSYPGRVSAVTGATADVHGVTTNFAGQRVPVDSVFSLARAAGLRTASAGFYYWYRGFAPHLDAFLRASKEFRSPDPQDVLRRQQEHCTETLDFARNTPLDFLVVDWWGGDTASHDFGALSPATFEIFSATDECLRQLAGALDLRQAVLIVAADHGHIESGGHGGGEPEVATIPAVFAGGPVRSGIKFSARQIDIAPTICALLGLPMPATSDGKVLLDILQVSSQTRHRLLALQEKQQQRLAQFRRALLGGNLQEARDIERRARTQTTGLAVLAILFTPVWVFLGVLRSGDEWRATLISLLAFYLVYFVLFSACGIGYSLSAINREEYLEAFFLKAMLVAGVSLLAAAFAAGFSARAFSLHLGPAATVMIGLTFVVQVLVVHWLEGLWMQQTLPDLDLLFKAYLDLLALVAFAFAVWLTPLFAWAGAALRGGVVRPLVGRARRR